MEEYGNGQLPHWPGIRDTSLQNCTQGIAPTFSMRSILSWYVLFPSTLSPSHEKTEESEKERYMQNPADD